MNDEAVGRLATAIASPAARRFEASGVVGEVVAGVQARLLEQIGVAVRPRPGERLTSRPIGRLNGCD